MLSVFPFYARFLHDIQQYTIDFRLYLRTTLIEDIVVLSCESL